MTGHSKMLKREVIKAGEALSLWESLLKEGKVYNNECVPLDRYVRRYCERYEGILAYKISNSKWNIYKEVWIRFLTEGFPDLEIRQPVMSLPAGLRYLHNNGLPQSYKLRQFKNDLLKKFPQWIIAKGTDGIERERITRGHLDKIIGYWNGNR